MHQGQTKGIPKGCIQIFILDGNVIFIEGVTLKELTLMIVTLIDCNPGQQLGIQILFIHKNTYLYIDPSTQKVIIKSIIISLPNILQPRVIHLESNQHYLFTHPSPAAPFSPSAATTESSPSSDRALSAVMAAMSWDASILSPAPWLTCGGVVDSDTSDRYSFLLLPCKSLFLEYYITIVLKLTSMSISLLVNYLKAYIIYVNFTAVMLFIIVYYHLFFITLLYLFEQLLYADYVQEII